MKSLRERELEILQDALNAFNYLPNLGLPTEDKTTYALANKIANLLKEITNTY